MFYLYLRGPFQTWSSVLVHSHNYPRSQTASKANGSCSVCLAVHLLHLKDGTIHLYGPRNKMYPGFHKHPLVDSGRVAPVSAASATADSAQDCVQVKPLTSDTDTNGHPRATASKYKYINSSRLCVPSDTCQMVDVRLVQQLSRPYEPMSWLSHWTPPGSWRWLVLG